MSCFESSSDRSSRESILPWNVTFWGDQPFQTTSLFMLDSGLLSYSIVSRLTLQFPAYGFCPLSRANGGVQNLTLNNQMPVLQGIFNGPNLPVEKNILKKRPAAKVCIHTHANRPSYFLMNFRVIDVQNWLCIPPFRIQFLRIITEMKSYLRLIMGKQWPLEGTNFSLGLTLDFGRKFLPNLSPIPTRA